MMAFLLILSGGIHKLIKKRFITSTKGEKLDKNQQNNTWILEWTMNVQSCKKH